MAGTPLHADEGMWLYSNPPAEYLKQKYGFELTDGVARPRPAVERPVQLRRVGRRSSRPTGWSSPTTTSAPMTCRSSSNEKNDYLKNGFYAKTRPRK